MSISYQNNPGNNTSTMADAMALQYLYNGFAQDVTPNMVIRSRDVIEEDRKALGFDHAIEVMWTNFSITTAGNFDRSGREQNNNAAMKYPDVLLILRCSPVDTNIFLDEVARGNAHDEVKLTVVGRLGGEYMDRHLKIISEGIFHGVKFTHFENNPALGLVYIRFEYRKYRFENRKFGPDGVALGTKVSEIHIEDDAVGDIY